MDTPQRKTTESVMLFPYMAKGHTIPLLQLSSSLLARGIAVIIVTTPLNSSFLREFLPPDPKINLVVLPFPSHPSLPDSCESTDQLPSPNLIPVFIRATELLRRPFHSLLHSLSESDSLPLCVISDYFLGWTLDVCRSFHLPRIVFHGMGVFAMLLCKTLITTKAHLAAAAAGEQTFHVPGTPSQLLLSVPDVPHEHHDFGPSCDPLLPLLLENDEADVESWGLVVNSFAELDGDYVPHLEALYRPRGARAWLAGPLFLRHPSAAIVSGVSHPCLRWLDERQAKSVVYVSFGTQACPSPEQMEEVAHGLQMSGHEFILVARTPVSAPQARGLILQGWAPQRDVLMHPSIGGFLSHCGWNSVLESLSAGVPILAWPMIAEQRLNARFVVGEVGAGLRLSAGHGELIRRDEISERVKELMGAGEKGRRLRTKVEEIAKMALAAVVDGGSSERNLTQFVEEIRRVAKGTPGSG